MGGFVNVRIVSSRCVGSVSRRGPRRGSALMGIWRCGRLIWGFV